jgi:hypothetical protein
MITFPCHCSYQFSVPEDQAGSEIQCPKCGRLNDIPALSDLTHLDEHGTFKITDTSPAPPPVILTEAARAFTRETRDELGDEIDMRQDLDEFLASGEVPLAPPYDDVRTDIPKYDPITGELVAPIDLKRPEEQDPNYVDPATIPMAQPAVTYATGATAKHVTPRKIFVQLVQPVNLFVMFVVLFMHTFLLIAIVMWQAGIFFVAPLLFIMVWGILAHFANVIDETGPTQNDELPRPLRNLSWGEDLWGPAWRATIAIAICFWPLFWIGAVLDLRGGIAISSLLVTLSLAGMFLFPAILLTTTTSGALDNLRPDRVMGVIRALGPSYFLTVLAMGVAMFVYILGIVGCDAAIAALFVTKYVKVPLLAGGLSIPILAAGVYLMHFACWYLGLQYRAHHEAFEWILQRHVASKRRDMLAQLEARRAQIRRARMLNKNRPDREQRLAELHPNRRTPRNAVLPLEEPQPAPPAPAKEIWERLDEVDPNG